MEADELGLIGGILCEAHQLLHGHDGGSTVRHLLQAAMERHDGCGDGTVVQHAVRDEAGRPLWKVQAITWE